ncbi:hypothetical protein, conserved [Leishmania tarentolae]|uniref:Uncharacterized protein n=1 Tax=Leishmania tarentolae TaxID=5689 RepID=A0A640KDX3_LEITA|nr:hypothetical protein, conserved [Leishmania tarentolae]
MRRAGPTSRQDAPRHSGDDVSIAPAVATQRCYGGAASSSSAGPSLTALSPAGSMWSSVCREIASWRRGTVSIHDVDVWLRFNPYIRRGFRHRFLRKREALGSIVLYLHNETFNIVVHLFMVVLMALLLLWPPRVPAISSGDGASDFYDGAGEGSGLYTAAASASVQGSGDGAYYGEQAPSALFPRHRREAAEVPSWLRGLHGLVPTAGATAESNDKDGVQRSVPPVHDAASTRHALGNVAPGPTTSVPMRPFFVYLSGASAVRSSPTPIVPGINTMLPSPPMSVAARLSLSLTPLVLGLLLTFVLSVLYHTFMPCCRSNRGYQQLLQCDVMGVVFAISGSAYAYFTCGMPCAGESVQAWTAALMVVATLLCIYAAVLAPMWCVVTDVCALVLHLMQWAAATVIAAVLEFLMGRPLFSAPPCSSSVQRGGHDCDRQPVSPPPPPPEHHAGQHLLIWVQRHRRLSSVRFGAAPTSATATVAASSSADLVPLSALQRATVVGVYCLLHLAVYLLLVYPKSRPAMGGFTQATHYHNASYVWLCIGGLINAARFPEVVVFHWTRRAARHTRRVSAAEAAAHCAEELRRDASVAEVHTRGAPATSSSTHGASRSLRGSHSGVTTELAAQRASRQPTLLPSATVPTWWDRLCIPKLMVTYVISPSTLDYIGNSHNIWHVCTALSALSAILGVYYDCVEYDLVQCG